MIELKGIAWNHSRGFTPVVATAQRYEERHPEVRITWEKRSLQAFADAPMDRLAEAYDLIVMDHPHTALAASEGVLLPLDEHLPEEFLADQAVNSVGASHESYRFNGHQWTLATDAACPIATWRQDLVEKHSLDIPETWDQVIALAKQGLVGVSLFPVDVLMHTFMFCEAQGEMPFQEEDVVASDGVLEQALACLRELASLCDPRFLEWNPIRTAEFMTESDEVVYCPFAYGYSNYSRPGYAGNILTAGGLVSYGGQPLRSVLGGAGLAVSSKTGAPQACVDYARFTASPEIQRGLYFTAGGQPGHRRAWTDPAVNSASNNFFRNTLESLDRAIVRPQYPGYMSFQDKATPVAHACVAGKASVAETIDKLNHLYRESKSR